MRTGDGGDDPLSSDNEQALDGEKMASSFRTQYVSNNFKTDQQRTPRVSPMPISSMNPPINQVYSEAQVPAINIFYFYFFFIFFTPYIT